MCYMPFIYLIMNEIFPHGDHHNDFVASLALCTAGSNAHLASVRYLYTACVVDHLTTVISMTI